MIYDGMCLTASDCVHRRRCRRSGGTTDFSGLCVTRDWAGKGGRRHHHEGVEALILSDHGILSIYLSSLIHSSRIDAPGFCVHSRRSRQDDRFGAMEWTSFLLVLGLFDSWLSLIG
jgi:hypothetical protein